MPMQRFTATAHLPYTPTQRQLLLLYRNEATLITFLKIAFFALVCRHESVLSSTYRKFVLRFYVNLQLQIDQMSPIGKRSVAAELDIY